MKHALQELDLETVVDRDVQILSGGELQRFALAVVYVQEADVYMIDEPSSYLDVRQRLKAASVSLDGDSSDLAFEPAIKVLSSRICRPC
mmetsp:Transcript_18470/g.74209  ORF Transcript_18470/g.74209 Transcript_18470/m.74209 type:complete len:89 (+) Transcript_18470:965-1231(+)